MHDLVIRNALVIDGTKAPRQRAPARIGRGEKVRVFHFPGAAPRLTTAALGLEEVWINGVQTTDAAGPVALERRPGMLLPNFAA
jgi:hypothetical protein